MDKILVTRPSMPPIDEYISEIQELWESRWLTNMGSKHRKLQGKLESYLGVDHIELLVNGHMALELGMQALNLQGEVITTPFTFASTTHAIVRSGLEPVFCDICRDNFTLDADLIEDLITEKTCAILPVHVYGNICKVDKIQKVADKYGLKVIYDAAHAFGERYDEIGIGNFGDISCFSFHATKVYNSIEGGAVSYKSSALGARLRKLKDFGISGPEEVCEVGTNAKMNEFAAAMGICNLRYIDAEVGKRREIDERYRYWLDGIHGIYLSPKNERVKSNYAYFPVVFDKEKFGCNRDEIYNELKKNGVFARKYFYPATNTLECFHGKYDKVKLPVALEISQKVLTLPLYADLPLTDVDRICSVILQCRKGE